MSEEIWRSIPGDSRREVSTEGRIRMWLRRPGRWKLLALRARHNGYSVYRARTAAGYRPQPVHHAVLRAFRGECPAGRECRHLNGDRTDNRLVNLAWGTPAENARDTVLLGARRPNPRRLGSFRARCLRALAGQGVRPSKLGRLFAISTSQARLVVNGKCWRPFPVSRGPAPEEAQ
jgi:hypothetical protein